MNNNYNTRDENKNFDRKPMQEYSNNSDEKKSNNKIFDKILRTTGIILLMFFFFIVALNNEVSVDYSDAAQSAVKEQISTTLSVGTRILNSDETLESKDYNITHSSNSDETKIWVWDYAAEDGDYVQILVNDVPIGDSFFIKNVPQEFKVPSVGKIQVKGIRDGGGGITYAIRYEINNTNYFNTAPLNECNTYTLVIE